MTLAIHIMTQFIAAGVTISYRLGWYETIGIPFPKD